MALGVLLILCVSSDIIKASKPREYPKAYCIDPFASADLGQVVYTHCTLVPMWSMKV